jgi:hypothetical protein
MSENQRQPYEKPTLTEELRPEPLGDDILLDDPTEDHARANTTIGDVVEEDLDSQHTKSRRLPDGGAAGFQVPTEPIAADMDRPTDTLPPI